MADLPEETLTTVFQLQKQLFNIVNEATKTDYNLVELIGRNIGNSLRIRRITKY